MLLSLHIKNYALIEDLRLEFAAGFNVFTGETGAGKSIIVESIGLILGERASVDSIRKGAERCFITAEFDCGNLKDLNAFLQTAGLLNGGNLIIRREIDAAGKSRAFINDTPVSLATLAAAGKFLIDLHGQHEHQTLMQSAEQRSLLDSFGELEALRDQVGEQYHLWKDFAAQQQSKQLSEQERARMVDLYTFQLTEIDDAKLTATEEEEIEAALPQQKNAEKLGNISNEAYNTLYGGEGAVMEKLARVQKLLETIVSTGGQLAETAENLKNAVYQIEGIASDIEAYKNKLSSDPERLNELLERQDLIHKLKKKYGATIADVIVYREKIASELDALSKADQNRAELDAKAAAAAAELEKLCTKLTAQRKKAGDKLTAQIQKELSDLGMKKARFELSLQKEATPTSTGQDIINFMFSANPGEDIKPLKNIASGGEISRVMLAIKTVLAKSDKIPVLIFDEIDTGIGGPMGQVIGVKMKNLAVHHQVITITHLPQIAALGEHNISVTKESKAGRTFTRAAILNEGEHIAEVARMLSGAEVTPAALKHAEELVAKSMH